MKQDSLSKFIERVRAGWGPLNTKLVEKTRALMEELANAPLSEPWLAELQASLPEGRELYRDLKHGFILLAHTESAGLYRPPHDHGEGWVIYAVQRGLMEMGTYGLSGGLVRRESYRVEAGQSRAYLPGDIHDTKCLSSSVLMLRLTSCDLKEEMKAGRMKIYAEEK